MASSNGLHSEQAVLPAQLPPDLDNAGNLPFGERIQHARWQVRKHLYEQLSEMFERTEPLVKLGLTIESFCPWIKNMLGEQHPSSLSEALRSIELFTRKYSLSVGSVNNFVTVLVERTGSSNLNIKLAEEVLLNCMNTPQKAWFVVSELSRYCHHKNQRIALFAIEGVGFALQKYQLTDDKETLSLFKLLTTILEQTASKEIRTSAIRSMVVVLQYVNEPFEELCQCEFRGIRPVVIRELATALNIKIAETPAPAVMKSSQLVQALQQRQPAAQDLMNVVPPNFFEFRRLKEANDRIKVLEDMDSKLAKLSGIAQAKDYSQLFNHMELPLEDQNFLVVSAIVRVLGRLLRLCPAMIAPSNAKRLLALTVDKYKGPKSKTFNVLIHQLVREFVTNRSLSLEYIVDILTEVVDKSKNLNAKIGVLEWLATEFEDICIGILTGTEVSLGTEEGGANKIKRISNNLKKRLELMVKLDSFLKVKEDLRGVIQVLSNIETGEKRETLKSRTATAFTKMEQSAKFSQTLANSKSRERNINKSPMRKSVNQFVKKAQPRQSPVKAEVVQQPVARSNKQQTLIDRLERKLTSLRNEALSGAKQSHLTREFIMLRNTMLTPEGRPYFRQVMECLITFSDELSCLDLSKNKLTTNIKPRVRDLLFDWTVECMLTINEWLRSFDDVAVQMQLELILLKGSANVDLVERLVHSIFARCNYETLLRKAAQIFKSSGCNPISKQVVSHFLREKTDSAEVSDESLKKCYAELLGTDGELALAVRARLKSSTFGANVSTSAVNLSSSSVLHPKVKIATPTKSPSPTKELDHSHSRERTNSDISTISEQIMHFQDAIIDNFSVGLLEFQRQLESIPADTDLLGVHSRAGYQRIVKTVCCRINLTNWAQAQSFLLMIKQRLKSDGLLVAKVVWMTMCLTNIFIGDKMESARNSLFSRLVEGFQRTKVLTCFKEVFSAVYKMFGGSDQTKNLAVSVLTWILETFLQGGVTVKQLQYLSECLCFCLTVPELNKLAVGQLQSLHQNRGSFTSVQKLFRMKLAKSPELLRAYQSWIDGVVHRESTEPQQQRLDLTEGTIADLTQIHQLSYDEDSRSAIAGGLQVFLESKKHQSPEGKHNSKTPSNFKLALSKSNKREKSQERSHGRSVERPHKFLASMEKELEELERSLEYSKVVSPKPPQEIKEVDEYDVERNRAENLLAEEGVDSSECIRQLQDMLLNCDDSPGQLLDSLLQTYSSLEGHRQDQFVADLRSCILHSDFLLCLSEVGYRTTLQLLLKLCSNVPDVPKQIPQQKHETTSSKNIQYMLHVVLSFKNANGAALACLAILNEEVPDNLSLELPSATKLLVRLVTNCLQKLIGILKPPEMRVFELLMAVYKFFKRHPPERLVAGMPSVGEFEHLFRVLRGISDQLITAQPNRAMDLVRFVKRPGAKSIYVEYLEASLK